MRVLKVLSDILLIPFSLLYGMVMEIRNLLYDIRLFRIHRFPVPVISVGNLTTGGSGKTPLTILLARHFSESRQVAVVSRGYGRNTKGVRLVSDGRQVLLNAREAGDEPYLIARSVPEAVVMVAEKRRKGIDQLLGPFNPGLVVLDDAFQHRSVHRDVDIVLVNAGEKKGIRLPLPGGRLREFSYNIRRADMVVLTNVPEGYSGKKSGKRGVPVFTSRPVPGQLVDKVLQPAGPIERLRGEPVYAFCAIAHPEYFYNLLTVADLAPEGRASFRDHYAYTKEDIADIMRRAEKHRCRYVICTEKDMVKIQHLALPGLDNLFAIRISLELADEKLFFGELVSRIDKE